MAPFTLTATTAGIIFTLAYYRTGHGPLRLTVQTLIRLQASLSCMREALDDAKDTYRKQYGKHLARIVRSY